MTVCRSRILSHEQQLRVLRRSIEINPANADEQRVLERTPPGRRGGPRRLAVVIGRKWPETGVELPVRFLDNPPQDLRARLLVHMNAWSKFANVRFVETTGTGMVRIARLDAPDDVAGYWSYVGTEILGIEDDQPTMNLEGFTMRTSEAEFKRVVRHEAGHTLGFDHEHMRAELVRKIDRRKAFVYFDRAEGWTKQETIEQVLTPLSAASIMGTSEADPNSIMCYQIPAAITTDGKAIAGGSDITTKDGAFAAKIYPLKPVARDAPATPAPSSVPLPTLAPAGADDSFHVVIMDRFDHDGSASATGTARAKFVRVFASYAGARVTVPMRVRADDGEPSTRFPDIIRMHERLKQYTNRQRGSVPSAAKMIAFGSDLFETLFQGDVRRLYDEARSRQHGRKLDFVLTSMVPWIAEKPWEFAYDTSRRSFLATEDVHFVRNVLTAVPADSFPERTGPLRILVASAQPAGFGQLSIEQEKRVIERGFERLKQAGLVEIKVLARATPSDIHAHLASGHFAVVHFIGHGEFNEDTQQGSLVFENTRGTEFLLGERSVREIFCQRGVTLVFLNACQTAAGGRADFNKGVAQSLVAHGLPALVANQYSVLDSSATYFAQHFYASLATGMTIGEAAREARIAVNYSMDGRGGEIIDWAVPVVYARNPSMRLLARSASVAPSPTSRTLATGRRAVAQRATTVAVWDIDGVFPALNGTLTRMNDVQHRFGFELVDISAPVDAWDMENKQDGTPYLMADTLAERLSRMPRELGVNVLACVTRHWMRSKDDFNLYAWWPDENGPPVLIFSCAGFADLPAEGPQTDNAIVNVMVSSLAGYLADIGSHEHGPKDCPMWYNRKRDPKFLVGLQKFDRACRGKLARKIGSDLPALEALLTAFH